MFNQKINLMKEIKMNELDYSRMNGEGEIERYGLCKKLIEDILTSPNNIKRQHEQIIMDSLDKLELLTRMELSSTKNVGEEK